MGRRIKDRGADDLQFTAMIDYGVIMLRRSGPSKKQKQTRSAKRDGRTIDRGKIAAFCRRHHVRRLALFGSVLRRNFSPRSDIDMLIEFLPGHTPGLAFFGMEEELGRLVGRRVDLNTPGFLSPDIRVEVLAEAHVLYEQA